MTALDVDYSFALGLLKTCVTGLLIAALMRYYP